MTMKTSAQGRATLEHEEGVVLKAYLCPAGIWTIGAGLTAASGVVKPRAGMVITHEEASRLLALALERNYEPAVARAMAGARQHEFDAGVSFHFNTGAIRRASWVKLWLAKAAPAAIRGSLLKWNKGGGKVLPGLTKRRDREADMLLKGIYPVAAPAQSDRERLRYATWALTLDAAEKGEVRVALRRLGYHPGDTWVDQIDRQAVERFQRDHGLTVDGIIGRATLSTLQRRIDAARKAGPAVATPALAAAGTSTDAYDAVGLAPGADWLILGLTLAFALWTAWRYRDVVAALIHRPLPRLAAFLRSF
jgi:lysozyme